MAGLKYDIIFFFQWLLQPLQGPGLFFSSGAMEDSCKGGQEFKEPSDHYLL
jgi:hypothetical protein